MPRAAASAPAATSSCWRESGAGDGERGARLLPRGISAQPPALHLPQADRRLHGRDHHGRRRRHLAALPATASRPRTPASPCPRRRSACSPTSAAAGICRACPGRVGQFLALTGARLDGAECRCARPRHPLCAVDSRSTRSRRGSPSEPERIEALLDEAQRHSARRPGSPAICALIDRTVRVRRYEEILAALEADGSDWAATELATLRDQEPAGLQGLAAPARDGARDAGLRRRDAPGICASPRRVVAAPRFRRGRARAARRQGQCSRTGTRPTPEGVDRGDDRRDLRAAARRTRNGRRFPETEP